MSKQITLLINHEVLNDFPELQVSGLLVTGIFPRTESKSLQLYISSLMESMEENKEIAKETINEWRQVYSQMGIKPSKFPCSFESLYRRLIKGKNPFGINRLVDTYNAVSIKHQLCMGAYDLDKLGNTLSLRYAESGELMLPIGGEKPIVFTDKNIVYADNQKITCAYWNHRDAEVTKVTEQTNKVIFFIDEVVKKNGQAEQALEDLRQLLQSYSNGLHLQSFSLDSSHTSQVLKYKE